MLIFVKCSCGFVVDVEFSESVTSRPSSAPRWPTLSSHIHVCSPDRAERLDCWLGCLGWARPIETKHNHTRIMGRYLNELNLTALFNNICRAYIPPQNHLNVKKHKYT